MSPDGFLLLLYTLPLLTVLGHAAYLGSFSELSLFEHIVLGSWGIILVFSFLFTIGKFVQDYLARK